MIDKSSCFSLSLLLPLQLIVLLPLCLLAVTTLRPFTLLELTLLDEEDDDDDEDD